MVDRSLIDDMLGAYRFDEAEQLLGDDPEPDLREELSRRRADAQGAARALYEQITELGGQGYQDQVVELARDPHNLRLLALLPDTTRKRAELYLRDARRWEAARRETHERRLGEARRALAGLDLELAKGLVKRIDARFLSEDRQDEMDQLILDLSAREMETESLTESTRHLIDQQDSQHGTRARPWWRRWSG